MRFFFQRVILALKQIKWYGRERGKGGEDKESTAADGPSGKVDSTPGGEAPGRNTTVVSLGKRCKLGWQSIVRGIECEVQEIGRSLILVGYYKEELGLMIYYYITKHLKT